MTATSSVVMMAAGLLGRLAPGVSAVPLTVMPTVVEAEALLVPTSSVEVVVKCSVSVPSYSLFGV